MHPEGSPEAPKAPIEGNIYSHIDGSRLFKMFLGGPCMRIESYENLGLSLHRFLRSHLPRNICCCVDDICMLAGYMDTEVKPPS